MNKLKRILVPVDFSPSAEVALQYAALLAEAYSAKVDVLHVVERGARPGQAIAKGSTTVMTADTFRVEAEMHRLLMVLPADLRDLVDVHYGSGDAASSILQKAAAGYDLIVMGRVGTHKRAPDNTGSVTAAVEQLAPCPVAAVGEAELERAAERLGHGRPTVGCS